MNNSTASGEDSEALFDAVEVALRNLGHYIDRTAASTPHRPVLTFHTANDRNAAIASLDDAIGHLDMLEAGCNYALRKLNRQLLTVRSRKASCRNALSPVTGLPDDILRIVFEYAIFAAEDDADPYYLQYQPIQTLSDVSVSWRRAAMSTPSLWAYVNLATSCPGWVFPRHINLSKSRPLRLRVVDPSRDQFSLDGSSTPQKWARRIESLDWRSQIPAGPSLLSGKTFSSLQTCSLSSNDCQFCGGIPIERETCRALNELKFPRLVSLNLSRLNLSKLSRIRAPMLTSLDLFAVDIGPAALDKVFASLGTLEVLSVSLMPDYRLRASIFDIVNGADPFERWSSPSYTLPSLHTLRCRDLNYNSTLYFHAASRYPSLRTWEYEREGPLLGDIANLPDQLNLFMLDCPGLEDVTLNVPSEHVFDMLTALNPNFAAAHYLDVPALCPMLRRLSIAVTGLCAPSQEQKLQHQILSVIRKTAELRKAMSPRTRALESLSLSSCVVTDEKRIELEALFADVTITKCRNAECEYPGTMARMGIGQAS